MMTNRIGIIGGGQLGRMLTIPALEMGFDVTVLDPTPECPAAQVGAAQIVSALTDEKAIRQFAAQSDFLTYEIEHINTDILITLAAEGTVINPSPQTLAIIKNKLAQKEFLDSIGIPVARFLAVETETDISNAAKHFGYPLLLKTRFGGYDGRGNAFIKRKQDIAKALEKFAGQPVYVEQFVPFVKELAIMVARSMKGEIAAYPVVETMHQNNILHYTLSPAPIAPKLTKKATRFATDVMEELDGAGVFGIEMFLTKEDEILINEIAPRVHNSGHYTIEACETSQFEQHIRAITGLPLGSTALRCNAAVMVNILGERLGAANLTGLDKALAIPGSFLHSYGKSQTKPERKMGHITVLGNSVEECLKKAKKARKSISI